MLRFLGAIGPCNYQTSWVSYEWISSGDPEVGWRILIILGPGGHFLGNPWVLDPEGPHSAILGEATLGTYWGIAFYRSEAGHYRVLVLHAAFCRKPLSGLEGAGVGENPNVRLCFFPRLEKQDIISWDPVNTLEQYKVVKTTEAELLGLPPPSFEYEPQVPGGEEVKKTLEPDADDPPAE
ncbi:hypothetical protein DY000_02022125 [Brassica cretica]|uniref:Uncharacterized protein n=1 Tax=Brassica cretica TaxID=69181 RepID=A0ABQ7EL49_BRACR|nr:hypothetical protein DY000_02022125 [Brassica cretica]